MRKKVLSILVVAVVLTFVLVGCSVSSGTSTPEEQEAYVTSISIDQSTIPDVAYAGEFNVSDLRLNVVFSDESVKTISVDSSMIMTDSVNKLNKVGTQIIRVYYENCQTSFNIKLIEKEKKTYTLKIYGGRPTEIDGVPIGNEIIVVGEYYEASYEEGTVITIEWIPVEGNSFTEWTDLYNAQFRDTQSITKATMNMNHTYKASSSPAVMTVNFETNCEYSIGSKKTDVLYETDIQELTKEGYVFDGWTTEKLIGEEAIDSSAKKITFPYTVTVDNCTLYGMWRRLGLEYISYTNPITGNSGYKVSGYVKNDKELTIPSRHDGLNVIAIDADALSGATALEKLSIPATIEEIGDGFVRNCARLKEIELAANSNRFAVNDGILYNYNMDELIAYPAGKLSSILILENIKNIHDYAFYGAVVGGIELPSSLDTIGEFAFDSCHIDYVNFSSVNPTEPGFGIGETIFNDNITTIFVPSAYTDALKRYTALAKFEDKFNSNTDAIPNIGINEQHTLLYKEITNENSDAEFITTTVEIIGADRTMTDIIIPTVLGNYDVSSVGVKAFNGCIYLTSVTIPVESKLERILDDAFAGTPYIEKLASETIIANGILYKYLGDESVYKVPESVSRIAEGAFRNNLSLQRIDLTENNKLSYIGPYAFYGCSSLIGTVDDTEKGFYVKNLVKIANYAFAYSGIIEFSLAQENVLSYIGKEAFADCHRLKYMSIGSDTSEIDSTAFNFCYALQSFSITGEETNLKYKVVDGVLYSSENADGHFNAIYLYPAGKMATEYAIVKEVEDADGQSYTVVNHISDYAFFYSNIAALFVPDTITSVSSTAIIVPGLSYVRFETLDEKTFTYEDLFVIAGDDYRKFAPDYVVIAESSENIDSFFGNNAVLKNEKYSSQIKNELVVADGLILELKRNDEYSYASVVRVDRTMTEATIPENYTEAYYITTIEGYAFVGYYLQELTLGKRISKLESYSLKYAENLEKLFVRSESGLPVAEEYAFGDKFDNGMFVYVAEGMISEIKKEWNMSSEKYIIDISIGLPKATFVYAEGEAPLSGTGPVESIVGEITAEWINENIPERRGYAFVGWMDDDGKVIDFSSAYIIPYNIELTCKWAPAEFRIIFNIEQKVEFAGDKETVIKYGDSYKFVAPTYSDGSKTFVHWETEAGDKIELSGIWEPRFDISTTTIKLYPRWEVREFVLVYDIPVVDGENEIASAKVKYDEDYTLGIPKKTGYIFKGWALDTAGEQMITNADGKSLLCWEVTDNDEVNIYSVWEADSITVNLYFDQNQKFKTVSQKFGKEFSFPYDGINDEQWAQKKSIFCGWYKSDAETGKTVRYTDENGAGLFLWADGVEVDLYAQWPIEVTSESDIHEAALTQSFILCNDIVVTKPIGSGNNPFEGIFMGNGYKITFDYTVSSDTEFDGYIGLFAYNKGTLKDVLAEIKINIESTDGLATDSPLYVGALTGKNEGIIRNSSCEGADIEAEIALSITSGGVEPSEVYVGGYCGYNHNGTIKNVSMNLLALTISINGVGYGAASTSNNYACGTVIGCVNGGSIGISSAEASGEEVNEAFSYYYTDDEDPFKNIACGKNLSETPINISISTVKKS